ncbi:hypothetical protein ACQR50_16230 [Sphingomonas sp. Xoc002]|uniref:hypothetical protein n=1 Tax=Sphingomonas sp. Xoc002 TaxID=2837624 RepID=UPI003D17A387
MNDSTLDYSIIDGLISALEREATLLAHESCGDSPDMAAIGRRRRLKKLNNKVIKVRESYQQLVAYEKIMDQHVEDMKSLKEDFGDLLKDR